jgi:hypothetical protein
MIFREELAELVEILNDPSIGRVKFKVTAVQNDEIGSGNYDAVLVAFSGYRSNFLFDLYNIFLREPDFETYSINLQTTVDAKGKQLSAPHHSANERTFSALISAHRLTNYDDVKQLLSHLYGFMSTHEIGDKQAYAQLVDQLEQKLVLGSWLFSLPSLAYFGTQFDQATIDLYGTASQLSTIEKWQEKKKK